MKFYDTLLFSCPLIWEQSILLLCFYLYNLHHKDVLCSRESPLFSCSGGRGGVNCSKNLTSSKRKSPDLSSKSRLFPMAHLAGFEPTAFRLGVNKDVLSIGCCDVLLCRRIQQYQEKRRNRMFSKSTLYRLILLRFGAST